MKLSEAELKIALFDRDWQRVARVLFAHAGLPDNPCGYSILFEKTSGGKKEVIIFLKSGGFVSWAQGAGFATDEKYEYNESGNIVVRNF